MEKKKLLVVIQHLRRGGVELAAINFASNLNKEKYSITYYLVDVQNYHDEALEKELLASGAKSLRFHTASMAILKDISTQKDYFRRKIRYSSFACDVFQRHNSRCGKALRSKKIVTHSHGTKWNHKENAIFKAYKAVMRKLINKNATHILACSESAGEYLYGKTEYKKGAFSCQTA